jgi:murein tripeptide amidase MpaA
MLCCLFAGESMAEWFADGLLERLTDKHDAIARHLLRDACVYVMPNVNPDGTWRGHLRTNAAGESSKQCTKHHQMLAVQQLAAPACA